jgi:hypothetical protein
LAASGKSATGMHQDCITRKESLNSSRDAKA